MEPLEDIKRRLYIALALAGLLPVCVAWQMLSIHVNERDALVEQGERQANTMVSIPALRGSIYDRHGRELVINTASYHLALDPTVERFTSSEKRRFLENLSTLTGKPVAYFEDKIANRVSPKYVLLWKGLSESDRSVIENWDIPGSLLVRTYTRRYNYGKTASHVIGYVDRDGRGIDGLELQYESYLDGTPGHRAVQRDRNGEIKAYVAGHTVEPVDGQDLILTIDLELQTILEDELLRGVSETRSEWGSVIAMDPFSGEILGMANVPFYDPNRFYAFKSASRRNRAITDQIEPGSTFKLVTAIAAVESGVVSTADSLDTGNGFAVVSGRSLHDLHGYGTITFAEAIAKSSNIGIAKTAVKLDKGIMYQYARNLGFGQKTWIDLPGEVDGTLKKPREWSGTSQTTMSIGYEVDVTPLQMITAYSALANGGLLLKPYVVAERRHKDGGILWKALPDSIRRAFKPETADALLPAFVDVVESGSAKRARIDGIRIAGKTGTARVIIDGSYDTNLHRASFVGFFPADQPKLAILIMLARPEVRGNSGAITTPIFNRIARRWISARPDLIPTSPADRPELALNRHRVTNLAGQPVAIAAARLRAAGYQVKSNGKSNKDNHTFLPVIGHDQPDTSPGASVKLTIDDTAAELELMPDLTGLGVRQAVHWARAAGMNVQVEGTGMVVSQTPKPGEPLMATAVLRCQ